MTFTTDLAGNRHSTTNGQFTGKPQTAGEPLPVDAWAHLALGEDQYFDGTEFADDALDFIEVRRDLTDDGEEELVVETGTVINFHSAAPEHLSSEQVAEFITAHEEDIDLWLGERYGNIRFGTGSWDDQPLILWAGASELGDDAFPSDLDSAIGAAHRHTGITRLTSDVEDGSFHSDLRDHLERLEVSGV